MKLVLLSGKAGSGKSTIQGIVADELNRKGYRCVKANFADLLKYICEKYLDWDGEKDDYGRALLQQVGTDIVKRNDPTYWIRFIADIISYFGGVYDYMIVGDCRFEDEITYFKENEIRNLDDVISIRIERENNNGCANKESSEHISEVALDEYSEFDFIVKNIEWRPDIAAKKIIGAIAY